MKHLPRNEAQLNQIIQNKMKAMNKVISVTVAPLLTGCMMVNARTSHTGHLFVALTDKGGSDGFHVMCSKRQIGE